MEETKRPLSDFRMKSSYSGKPTSCDGVSACISHPNLEEEHLTDSSASVADFTPKSDNAGIVTPIKHDQTSDRDKSFEVPKKVDSVRS